jgi:hypothetical protein
MAGALGAGKTLDFIVVLGQNAEPSRPWMLSGVGRRRQKGWACGERGHRPMIRDIPPCIRASRAALQPLIGGAMKSLQTRSSTRQEARAAIAGDGNINAWGHILPSGSPSSFASFNRYQRSPKTAVESEPPTADVTCFASNSRQIIPSRTPATRSGQPQIQEAEDLSTARGHSHVTTGSLK